MRHLDLFSGIGSMRNHFPQAEIELVYSFTATHHLPLAAMREAHTPHEHQYDITVGMRHEWNINVGWALDSADISSKCRPVIEGLNGADLNNLLNPVPPTLEAVAAYILLQLPFTVNYVKAYCGMDGEMTAKVQRNWVADLLRKAWDENSA